MVSQEIYWFYLALGTENDTVIIVETAGTA